MTAMSATAVLVSALDLPPGARVDARVPKKMLVEQGAPTAADKRAIQDGVEEIQWLAALKPNTVAIPAFADEVRDYAEIAVIVAIFRAEARAARLTELVHRAIPYPVLLISADSSGVAISVAPKRAAQNEGGKVVVERVVAVSGLDPIVPPETERAFMDSLALGNQPSRNLLTVYEGWLARIEALAAARLSGNYVANDDGSAIERRRAALERLAQLARDIAGLRVKAGREKQLNRRVDLNIEIQRLEQAMTAQKQYL
ncbi:DUF4391 domain-containing protein [Rhodospirillum sp. A1_3_36]|uniref:DUF4391 domain-containing protein n=1 Tax=Rhodospirillum sp. A1_3_36 TaxID=3391666 RepID=UPI0039A46FF2